ncbi:winged helix-turn-helix transcriptional regulator [Thioclava sp. JE_KL1]|nr:winged helix-turn-helix transcriptional regulator [Thioclava sp. JE_KL1]
MAGQRSKIQEDIRFRILRLLEENPEISQRDLAREVGISTGSANSC